MTDMLATSLGLTTPLPWWAYTVLGILLVWTLFWKGVALWQSVKRGGIKWFILLLLVNTFGIIELIYLFGVLKINPEQLFKDLFKRSEGKIS